MQFPLFMYHLYILVGWGSRKFAIVSYVGRVMGYLNRGTKNVRIIWLNNSANDFVHQIVKLASLCVLADVIEEVFLVFEVSSLAVGPTQPVFGGY